MLDTVSGGAYLFDGATRDSWHRIAIGAETGFVAAAYVAEIRPAVQLRGAWIPDGRHSSVLKTPAGIAEALDFLQEYGLNAVFLAVWNRGLTAFPSRVMERHGFAVQDHQYGGFDHLGAIVREGNKRGMAVLPWFEYGFASSPDADGGPILRAMDLVVEVIGTYDVQGIQGDRSTCGRSRRRLGELPVGSHDRLSRPHRSHGQGGQARGPGFHGPNSFPHGPTRTDAGFRFLDAQRACGFPTSLALPF